MIPKKEKVLRRVALYLYKKIHTSPNELSMIRVFLTPWVTLLLVETMKDGDVVLAVATISLYFFVVSTDFLDGPLARALIARRANLHNEGYGAALDRISDKLLIAFSLVPFGANPFIVGIIAGESVLLYQALYATTVVERRATYVGKIKMILQTFCMPMLLLAFLKVPFIGDILPWYMGLTLVSTLLSIVSHYRK